jgi:predicted phage-related endonuclease
MPPLTEKNAAIRAVNVSASEVAALMPSGHPYASAQSIYDRLVNPERAKPGSQAMRIGSAMEPSILRFAEAELGFKARANATTFVHPWVRLCATPDAFARSRMPWAITTERALIEVKMSGRADGWRDIPDYIEWQCRAQLACTGYDVVYIVVLAAMRLLSFPVFRERDKEAQLSDAVLAFWQDHVIPRVRPEPAAPAIATPFSFDDVARQPEPTASASSPSALKAAERTTT